MPSALIQINAATAGAGVLNLPRNTVITLTDAGGAPAPSSRLWTILKWPTQRAAAPALAPDAVSSSVTFNPGYDDGMYVIVLSRVDSGVTSVDIVVAAVADQDGFSLPCPGVSGSICNFDGDQTDAMEMGWAGGSKGTSDRFLNMIIRHMKAKMRRKHEFVGIAGSQVTSMTAGWDGRGAIRLDPAILTDGNYGGPTQYRLKAFLETTNGANSAGLRLYNLTDVASVSTITTTALVPTYVESGLLTLPTAVKDYEFQLMMGAGAAPDYITCKKAWIETV